MLVKIFGSAVFGVEATTIIVDVFVAAIFIDQKGAPYLCFLFKKVGKLAFYLKVQWMHVREFIA